ncbi:MAG: putative metal-binding motif-containing protein [Myxococcota bacterium]
MRLAAFLVPFVLLAACDGAAPADDKDDTAVVVETDSPEDVDGDGFTEAEGDCADDDAAVFPGAAEACNGVDDNCDATIDEDLPAGGWYADTDGDGFGDAAAASEDCGEPGAGYVVDASDCDDGDPAVYPGAAEACDAIDADCDGVADELGTWYADADGDGFGDAEAASEGCEAPDGAVADASDCDDTTAAAYPGNAEVCDELDNDCDGAVDEAVTTTYFADTDGDGWGTDTLTQEGCDVPTGYADRTGDCDDATDAVSPDAIERCDGEDDDCDGTIDEDDAIDATTWYVDADGDGYGDVGTSTAACEAPDDFVANADDCDDGDAATSPATVWYLDYDEDGYGGARVTAASCEQPAGYTATAEDCDDFDANNSPSGLEVCDGEDDDCDGEVDEGDAIDAVTSYGDADGDGWGDASVRAMGCDAPEGYVFFGTDCDDTSAGVSPGADETCNTMDDDCDGAVDEADAVDAETWHRDADGDGLGDFDVTAPGCEAPSGYVANASDCDDADARDTDGDGTQDCADEDLDGDGLRNAWDGDPYDAAVIRGPNTGLGTDGDLTVAGTQTLDEWTLLDGAASAGATSLVVDDAAALVEGDEVLVLSQRGTDAGRYQLVYVAGVSGRTVTIEPALSEAYSSSSVVLVQRVPHYVDVDVPVGATLTAEGWAGAGGGVVVFRATGTVTVAGAIDASALGYRGGDAVRGNSVNPYQGESYRSFGARGTTAANDGGGGSYPQREDNGDSGAGGGFGVAGSAGRSSAGTAVTTGGIAYGSATLASWFVGSGGGAGAPDDDSDGSSTTNITGAGGDGGGLVAVWAGVAIDVSGAVRADGGDGGVAVSGAGGDLGGGGGGSGGQILLAAPAVALDGVVSAVGGDGSSGAANDLTTFDASYGGAGGAGRVRVEYDTLGGVAYPGGDTTIPAPDAGSAGAWED